MIKNDKFVDLVMNHGNIYQETNRERYLQFPFWIREETGIFGKKTYFLCNQEDLPENLKNNSNFAK